MKHDCNCNFGKSIESVIKEAYGKAGNVLDPNNDVMAKGFFTSGHLTKPEFGGKKN